MHHEELGELAHEKQRRYDIFYMDIARRVAQMSHAKRNKVGAILVKDDRIVSMGWNGTPSGFDNCCEDENNITTQDVIHAEINLYAKLARSTDSAKDATLYVTLSPCVPCSLFTMQSGVRRVVYHEEYRVTDGLLKMKNKGIQVCHLVY